MVCRNRSYYSIKDISKINNYPVMLISVTTFVSLNSKTKRIANQKMQRCLSIILRILRGQFIYGKLEVRDEFVAFSWIWKVQHVCDFSSFTTQTSLKEWEDQREWRSKSEHHFSWLQDIEFQKAKNRCLTCNYIVEERRGVSNSVTKGSRSSRKRLLWLAC